jgi:hypothetical protein
MSRSRSHIRRQTAATQATIEVLGAPVAPTSRRSSSSHRVRPWAIVVAVSVILGLLASWIALASVGWLPPVPSGPWAPHVAYVAPMHHRVPRCYALGFGVPSRASGRATRLDAKQECVGAVCGR